MSVIKTITGPSGPETSINGAVILTFSSFAVYLVFLFFVGVALRSISSSISLLGVSGMISGSSSVSILDLAMVLLVFSVESSRGQGPFSRLASQSRESVFRAEVHV